MISICCSPSSDCSFFTPSEKKMLFVSEKRESSGIHPLHRDAHIPRTFPVNG